MNDNMHFEFVDTDLKSPINRVTFPVIARRSGKSFASGTAVLISPFLALTARHVLDDFNFKYDKLRTAGERNSGHHEGSYTIHLLQILPGAKHFIYWNVTKVWLCNYSDMAVLYLNTGEGAPKDFKWMSPKIRCVQPKIGERVCGFGYRNPIVSEDDGKTVISLAGTTSVGEVRENHWRQRDNSRLHFPCFRTNARYDGSMSGGPVFTNEGHLCGVICSNLPPTSNDEEHISYVTSISPLLAMDVECPPYNSGEAISIFDLAIDGYVSVVDLSQIIIEREGKKITKVGYRI